MNMDSFDISTRRFNVRFRGFDVGEVDAFLQGVAGKLQKTQDTITRLKTENAQLEAALGEKERELFSERQNQGNESVGEIEERCAFMLHEARIAADEIVTHAREDARRIIAEIDRLQNLKQQLEKYLESFLDFNSSMLEVWKMGKDGNSSDGDASDPRNE
jgi:cell division initiation protein